MRRWRGKAELPSEGAGDADWWSADWWTWWTWWTEWTRELVDLVDGVDMVDEVDSAEGQVAGRSANWWSANWYGWVRIDTEYYGERGWRGGGAWPPMIGR